MIPLSELVPGHWYFGEGRYAIAFWDGKLFRTFGFKFGAYVEMGMEYGERGFSPHGLAHDPKQ